MLPPKTVPPDSLSFTLSEWGLKREEAVFRRADCDDLAWGEHAGQEPFQLNRKSVWRQVSFAGEWTMHLLQPDFLICCPSCTHPLTATKVLWCGQMVTPLRPSLEKGQLVDQANRPAYCPVARCSRVMVTLVNRKRLPSIGDPTSSHAISGAVRGQKKSNRAKNW